MKTLSFRKMRRQRPVPAHLFSHLFSGPFLVGLTLTAAVSSQAQTAAPEAAPAASKQVLLAQLNVAQRLLDDEKYTEASKIIEDLLKLRPQNYGLHLMLASALVGQYSETESETEELRLLTQARASLVTARALATDDKDVQSSIATLMNVVQSELKDLQADNAPSAPIAPPQKAPKPAVQPAKPVVAPLPVEAPTTNTAPPALWQEGAMTSNLPLSLPGPATPITTKDPVILAKEAKNRKYPTHAAYDELATTYVQLGMYDDAVRNYRTNAQTFRRSNSEQAALVHDQYAARYENEVRLYVDRALSDSERASLNTRAPLEPPVGIYLGAFIDRDDRLKKTWTSEYSQTHNDPREFAQLVGKEHSTFFMYASYGNPFPYQWLKACKEAGVIPHLAWEPHGGLSSVQENEYLINFAKECGKLNWPIFLRFASEMNGGWTKWAGNPALYREKFTLVNRVFKQYAPRVATIWCVNSIPLPGLMDFYPGDENCDWVGINLYSVPFYTDNGVNKPADLDSPTNFIQPIYDLFKDRKPIAVCEYASSQMHISDGKPRIDFAVNKMSLLYGALPRLYPRIKMVSWFDQNNLVHAAENRRVNNFSLTENGIVLSAYRGLTGSPYFIAGGEKLNGNVAANELMPVPRPVVPGQNLKDTTRFSIWVKTPVARPLVYLQIGGKIVYAAKRPGAHVIDVDTSQIPKGRQPVSVYIYSDAGKFVAKQTTTLTFGPTRGDDTTPLYVTGTVNDYYTDRSGYVSALTLQTMGNTAYVHFAPAMAAQLLEQFPANGAFSAWLKPDPERGAGHWQLVSLAEEKPAAGLRRILPSDLQRLSEEPVVAADAPETTQTGQLTGVVTNEDDQILALQLDNDTLVRVPAALRAVPQATNALVLARNAEVRVTAKMEAPLEGAESGVGRRLVASEIEIGGLKASQLGLPLITVKQRREIAGEVKPAIKTRGVAANNLSANGFRLYLSPLPRDSARTTRGGGLAPIIPDNVRPW